MTIKSDIEIAQEAKPLPITDIADACRDGWGRI